MVVRAADESLSIAATADAHLLTRAAYHLGNRHVPLQIGADFVAYAHDHRARRHGARGWDWPSRSSGAV